MVDLKAAPFNLADADIAWVNQTLARLTTKEKAGQLFCACSREGTQEELDEIFGILQPGAVMFRPMPLETALKYKRMVNERSAIPALISANLEKGGNGIVNEGTMFHSPMGAAATKEYVRSARQLATICGREGAAAGATWAFSPIIDIDYNFRNPITNTRTFGSDPHRVKAMGVEFVKTIQGLGLAASIKHFPGDGVDERDQHLVVSVNDLSCEEWDATYGDIYKACINAGALSVMIGHIMLPAYQKKLNPSLRDNELMPATLSSELMQGLLRGQLGFNGLICTDATTMCGFAIPMSRPKAVPASIEAGADVFLFAKNLEEDFQYMLDGIADGTLSRQRLDDAVTRILAMKAALGLHKQRPEVLQEDALKVIGCEEHLAWAKECADASITLVKQESGVLPISPEKYKRILFCPIESEQGVVYSVKAGVCNEMMGHLRAEGFEVELFQPDPHLEGNMKRFADFVASCDLIVYVANKATKSNQTTVRIEWEQPMGANVPIYVQDIPTIFISVENPYHLLDVPRVKTYINAYSSADNVLQAIIDKLVGRSAFEGISPVDAFCGKWDAKL